MKKSINLRMSFSAGGAKRNIKTTITKDGKVVNPAELSEEQIAFCAKIAANKARRLSRSVVGFASEEVTVELPEDTDPAKIEAYVDAEVDRAVDEAGLTIEAEVEAEDFIDPLEDDNKDAQEIAATETEDAAEVVASQATIAEDAATAATEVAKASTDTKETREVTEKFARKGTQVRVFASADSTRQVRNEFFSKLKRGDY
jgi:hypothetical protein